jgi:hypothetical protein
MTIAPYYQYSFQSPEPIYALVKEELRSYFDSGAVDDLLFSLWTEKVLEKLGRGALKITNTFLDLVDGKAWLPDDFSAVRELWMLQTDTLVQQTASAAYSQVLATSIRLDTPDIKCEPCSDCNNPKIVQAIYKTTGAVLQQYTRSFLLRPGHIIDSPYPCANSISDSSTIYDIEDGQIRTNLTTGQLYLMYYATLQDQHGYQLVPNDVRIKEAIEYFLKFKIHEQLYNQATDESFNQCRVKKQEAEAEYFDKFTVAESWMKKETMEMKRAAIQRQKTRLNGYKFKDE